MHFLRAADEVVSSSANTIERLVHLTQLRHLRLGAVGDFLDRVGNFAGRRRDLSRGRRQIAGRVGDFVGSLRRAGSDSRQRHRRVVHRVSESPELARHLTLGALLQVSVTELNRVPDEEAQRTTNCPSGTNHDEDCDQRREDDYENEKAGACRGLTTELNGHRCQLLRP